VVLTVIKLLNCKLLCDYLKKLHCRKTRISKQIRFSHFFSWNLNPTRLFEEQRFYIWISIHSKNLFLGFLGQTKNYFSSGLIMSFQPIIVIELSSNYLEGKKELKSNQGCIGLSFLYFLKQKNSHVITDRFYFTFFY